MTASKKANLPSAVAGPSDDRIAGMILLLRGERVMLDSDLAELYGVSTGRLNEQVRRNAARFPEDFVTRLTAVEFANLISQFATSRWGGVEKCLMLLLNKVSQCFQVF